MFRHSLFYRLLSSSLIMGWLVSDPEEERADYISSSCLYHVSNRVLEAGLRVLYKIGDSLRQIAAGGIAGRDLAGFLGILIFFYLVMDIAFHDYSLRRNLIETALALGGLSIPLWRKIPGLWSGSLVVSFFRWWGNTD